jgi:MOSC domain-containing protein YiiM
MQIIATNIGTATTLLWQGQQIKTGIFKYPVAKGILLKKDLVDDDVVSDLKVHGGADKACYLFAADEYAYWQENYPQLEWNWGMFGENLTIEGLDESVIRIGNVYKIGQAIVQISQPREPCYKLGLRFGTQNIIQEFVERGHPGTYVRILQPGLVMKGDVMTLINQSTNTLTIRQLYELIYAANKSKDLVELALENEALPLAKKEKLRRFLK